MDEEILNILNCISEPKTVRLKKAAALIFKNHRPSVENIILLRRFLEEFTLEDLQLNCGQLKSQLDEALKKAPDGHFAIVWSVASSDDFVIHCFLLPKSCPLEFHDHPGMFVIMKILDGSARVRVMTRVSQEEEGAAITQIPLDDESIFESLFEPLAIGESALVVQNYDGVLKSQKLTKRKNKKAQMKSFQDSHLSLFPDSTQGWSSTKLCLPALANIHRVEACESYVCFLDVISPPYDDGARSCSYFMLEMIDDASGPYFRIRRQPPEDLEPQTFFSLQQTKNQDLLFEDLLLNHHQATNVVASYFLQCLFLEAKAQNMKVVYHIDWRVMQIQYGIFLHSKFFSFKNKTFHSTLSSRQIFILSHVLNHSQHFEPIIQSTESQCGVEGCLEHNDGEELSVILTRNLMLQIQDEVWKSRKYLSPFNACGTLSLIETLPYELIRTIGSWLDSLSLSVLAKCSKSLAGVTQTLVPLHQKQAQLFPHQEQSLRWMTAIENGENKPHWRLVSSCSDPLKFLGTWRKIELPLLSSSNSYRAIIVEGGELNLLHPEDLTFDQCKTQSSNLSIFALYLNASTREVAIGLNCHPQKSLSPWMGGGLFCDEPGLGKTLTILSLALRSYQSQDATSSFTSDFINRFFRLFCPIESSPVFLETPTYGVVFKWVLSKDAKKLDLPEGIVELQKKVKECAVFEEQELELSEHIKPEVHLNKTLKQLQSDPSWHCFQDQRDMITEISAAIKRRRRKSAENAQNLLQMGGSPSSRTFERLSDEETESLQILRTKKANSTLSTAPKDAKTLLISSQGTLVIAPRKLIVHWENEAKKWFKNEAPFLSLKTEDMFAMTGVKLSQYFAIFLAAESITPWALSEAEHKMNSEAELASSIEKCLTIGKEGQEFFALSQRIEEKLSSLPLHSLSPATAERLLFKLIQRHPASPNALLRMHFKRLVIDEGHSLESRPFYKGFPHFLRKLSVEKRWLMTGTPQSTESLTSLQRLFEFIQHPAFISYLPALLAKRPSTLIPSNGTRSYILSCLLQEVLVAHQKSVLSELPPLDGIYLVQVKPSMGEMLSYNDLVEMVHRNLYLTYYSSENTSCLLNPSNSLFASETLTNIRLSFLIEKLAFSSADFTHSLDMLKHCKSKESFAGTFNHQHYPPNQDRLDFIQQVRRLVLIDIVVLQTLLPPSGQTKQRSFIPCDRCSRSCRFPLIIPCPETHLLCLDCAATNKVGDQKKRLPLDKCPICKVCIHEDFFDRLQPSVRAEASSAGDLEGAGVPSFLVENEDHSPCTNKEKTEISSPISNLMTAESKKKDFSFKTYKVKQVIEIDVRLNSDLKFAIHNSEYKSLILKSSIIQYVASRIVQMMNNEKTKIIIVSLFWEKLFLLASLLETSLSIKVSHLYPKASLTDRNAAIPLFQSTEDNASSVLLLHPNLGSHGLDLHFASYMILMDPIPSASVEYQVISRAHRMGAVKSVVVEQCVLKGSLDEVILEERARWGRVSLTKRVLKKAQRSPSGQGRQTHLLAASPRISNSLQSSDVHVADNMEIESLLLKLRKL